jgi:hypothetical protein
VSASRNFLFQVKKRAEEKMMREENQDDFKTEKISEQDLSA